jgi:quercetin dioxygenase-like cupin family protein
MVYFGSSDFLILDGELQYEDGYMQGELGPGTWGYVPANSRLDGTVAPNGDTEWLQNFMGAVGFLAPNGRDICGLFTGRDIIDAAKEKGITLVPSTHNESSTLESSPLSYHGKDAAPLNAFSEGFAKIATNDSMIGTQDDKYVRPHYVNTNALPWVPTPGAPDVKVKILRVSEETGTTNMMVSQQAVVPQHQHMGPSDFIVLEGTMGLVGGREEGYGPGMWIYEDAGARHEGTYQKSEEDLVYLANIYGPVTFDSGPGTPILVVASFMNYVDIAESSGQPLVRNVFPDDSTLLVQQPTVL